MTSIGTSLGILAGGIVLGGLGAALVYASAQPEEKSGDEFIRRRSTKAARRERKAMRARVQRALA